MANTTTITKAAITACNPLINTCISTPTDVDFTIAVWRNIGGDEWELVTHNSTYATSIVYSIPGSTLTITWANSGVFRVVITG